MRQQPNIDAAPRVLIRSLRRIMADPGDAQSRLDRIVRQIARIMVAEVSSIYVRRRDGSFELYATEGLNPDAVHNTQLQRGEGLVGLVGESANLVNLDNAQSHAAFSYRPETGEENYRSFLGVPVLRDGNVLGVLTLQNKAARTYSPDEEDAMQTTAMVLAELLVDDALLGTQTGIDTGHQRSLLLRGLSLSEGLALGHVVLHKPRVVIRRLLADNVAEEADRLDTAIDRLRMDVDAMLERREVARAGEHREILETYRMFAQDRGWVGRMHETIKTGLTAEAAVERVRNDQRARMLNQNSAYWRERFRDLDDLSDRLLRALVGQTLTSAAGELPEDTILFARSMGPAELLDYDRARIRGLVVEDSGHNSHVGVVARALGIATLGQVRGAVDNADQGDAVVLDSTVGELHIRPSTDIIDAFADKVRFRARRQQQYKSLCDRPAVTRDNVPIDLAINAGFLVDLPHLDESGADGIGLFRTELEFMVSTSFPRRERQTEIYEQILAAAGDRPVVFRSLDIGSDKVLPYLRHVEEPNPALGWRSIRIALDRPALFRTQIRALLRAAPGRDLRIMLPMVTDVSEYHRARALVARERALMEKHGHIGPARVLLGVMVEVPALLWQLDELFEVVDFASVGSNDLLQFIFAADRDNLRVSSRFDPLSVPVLRMLKSVADAAARHDRPLSLCGELAGKPIGALLLVALGYRALSVAPANVGPVKSMLLGLDAGDASAFVERLMESGAEKVGDEVEAYAARHGISLDGSPPDDDIAPAPGPLLSATGS